MLVRLVVSSGLALALVLLSVPAARASLIEGDLLTAGDGLVTLDDQTGLLWLDVGLTDGLSYKDVASGLGNSWYEDGWRHATTAEMCQLFSAYVVTIDPCPSVPVTDLPDGAADSFLSFMEPNGDPGGSFGDAVVLNGAFDDGPESIAVGQGAIVLSAASHIVVQAPNGISPDVHDASLGNWLVRPVPEPATAVLFAVGLIALRASRRSLERSGN